MRSKTIHIFNRFSFAFFIELSEEVFFDSNAESIINIIDSKNLAEGKKLNDIWRIHILFPFTDGPGFYFQPFLIQKISKLQLIQGRGMQ